jgi:hypothetical protein
MLIVDAQERLEFFSMGNLFSLLSSTKRLTLFESTETSGVFVFGWEDFPPSLHPLSHIDQLTHP